MASSAWPKGSVKDVAESLGIVNLSDEVSLGLAADVEYRLREVVEESLKFMRHAKRQRLKVEDVDYALKAKNIEPLWGFSSSHNPIAYRKATHASGNLYFVDDEEIDLSRLSQSALPLIPREISYTAHWLAVEGVQPAIPQNPSPAEVHSAAVNARSASRTTAIGPEGTDVKPLVAHTLSKELQLYFDRLTLAAVDQDETMRAAALESFRGDTGIQGLIAYLIQWVAERVVTSLNSSLIALDQNLDILEAMLQNSSLFIDPYLHQILPPVLSILLTASLGSVSNSSQLYGLSHIAVRQHAAAFLSYLLKRYSQAYSALKPRILQTILRGLVSGSSADTRSAGSLVGALLGIRALGKDSIRRVFGARSPNLMQVGQALQRESFPEADRSACTQTILEALQEAYPTSPEHQTFDYQDLESVTGTYIAGYINSSCTPSVPRGILTELTAEETESLQQHHSGNRLRAEQREASTDAYASGEAESNQGDALTNGQNDEEEDDDDDDDIDMDAVNA